jgi:hypothetical protein
MHRSQPLLLAAFLIVACSTSTTSSAGANVSATRPATIVAAAPVLTISEIPGDYGHQHAGTSVDPDGNVKPDPEMVWFEVPKGRTATVAYGTRNGFFEGKTVVYKEDAKTEVMRFATDHQMGLHTDTVLQPGTRYYFTAWHKAGNMSLPWQPSHAHLMMKTATTYELQVDDGLAGTNQGDFDFNDFNLNITVK